MDMDLLVVVSLELENVGPVEAAEVVQCYVHDVDSTVYRPYHELKGFEKVLLKPTEKKTVSLALDHRAFSFWDVGTHQWVLEGGEFEIQIGSSSRDIRLRKNVMLESPQTASVQAKKSHPPVSLPLTKLSDSDDQFKIMMGKDVPVAGHATKLHYNSLLGDTGTHIHRENYPEEGIGNDAAERARPSRAPNKVFQGAPGATHRFAVWSCLVEEE